MDVWRRLSTYCMRSSVSSVLAAGTLASRLWITRKAHRPTPRSAICYASAMDTRLQISANLLLIFLIVGVAPYCLGEQPTAAGGAVIPPAPWQPSAGHTQIPLWPGGAPGARPADGAEVTGYGSKQVA